METMMGLLLIKSIYIFIYPFSYVRFCMPKYNSPLAQVVFLRESYYIRPNMLLPHEIEEALTNLFITTIKWSSKIKYLQRQVQQEDPNDLFNQLSEGLDYIKANTYKIFIIKSLKISVLQYLEDNGFRAEKEELFFLFDVADTERQGV